MRTVLHAAAALSLVAVTALFGVLAFWGWHAGHQAQVTIAQVGGAAERVSLAVEQTYESVQIAAGGLPQESVSWREMVRGQLERVNGSIAEVAKLREDAQPVLAEARQSLAEVRPVLASTQAAVDDAKASWDDMYWDLKAAVESGTVAAHAAGEASDTFSRRFPEMLTNAQQTNSEIAAIATDARKVADKIAAPKSFWAKLREGLWVAVKAAAAFL